MEYQNYIDMHTHSDNSFDGHNSCMLMCESAIEKGLDGIAITDHCEIDSKELDFRAFCSNQFVETFKTKRFFEGRLLVIQGIEIGQAIYNLPLANKILDKYSYDFVLGSIHNLKDMEDFFFLDYKKNDPDELLGRYFDAILELCEWNRFDSLAHLTYPLRYMAEQKINIDLSKYSEKIDKILKTLIKNGKALEINTSGLFMPIGKTLPDENIIKRFKELGGEYITIGSDSHYCEKLGQGVHEGMKIAENCGFDSITVYSHHEPILLNIE